MIVPQSGMKAIMYHYVRPSDKHLPFLKHLHIEDFRKQLDYFQETIGFVSKEEFMEALATGTPINGAVLTFDDGLKCHYDFVFPELKSRGLWGMFYVPTQMYNKNKLLDVHRIHVLLGSVSSQEIYNELVTLITDDILSDAARVEFKELTYRHQANDEATNLVKRTLNYYISYEFREQVIDKLMEKFIPDYINNVDNFYITASEIKEMNDNGMTIGSHTVSHPVLSKLNVSEQFSEINDSFRYLENACHGLDVKTFCYPYGGFHSFTNDTERILTEYGCDFAFNVEFRDIAPSDLTNRPMALPRYDCNQFEFGQVRV